MNTRVEKLDVQGPGTHFGIKKEQTQIVAQHLVTVLADTYTLYVATQYTHWNIRGMEFYSLHSMFETQYEELADAVDDIAERLRTIGFKAPGTLRGLAGKASYELEEQADTLKMIHQLIRGHEAVIKTCREAISRAVEADDLASEDFLVQRLNYHEKTAWMLRSLLA
jgi:starvation-inducible DNA-binding protein